MEKLALVLKIFTPLLIGCCVGYAIVFLYIGMYGQAAFMAALAAINYFSYKSVN